MISLSVICATWKKIFLVFPAVYGKSFKTEAFTSLSPTSDSSGRMGSSHEADKASWSEDETENLLNLVGVWRLEDSLQNSGSCVLHAMPHVIWCETCSKSLCRVCSQEHAARSHSTRSLKEVTDSLVSTLESETLVVGKLLNEVYKCERKQQDLILKVIDALSIVKRDLEEDLMTGSVIFSELPQVHDLITNARKTLGNGSAEPLSHLSALISSLSCRKQQLESVLFKAMVAPLHHLGSVPKQHNTDALKLINSYSSAKLGYSSLSNNISNNNIMKAISPPKYSPLVNGPRFYFDMEIQGVLLGRIVIETRPDVAPRMCENFRALATKERGFGFQGCVVFQCWKGESVITGDFEHNNGRGGHSIYEEGLFMPEDTRLPATRGAIGMRRTQKRHDSKGLVGSQFRIILQDMPGFTGIFGHVLEGIEIVDKISECGDPSGNPTKRISIRKCGALK